MAKVIVGVPSDSSPTQMKFFTQFEKSFHHFHPNIEVRRFDNPDSTDKDFWYRAKPIIGLQLLKEGFDTVILADSDQIVLGSLDELINDTQIYDAAVVLNDPTYPIQFWDIRAPYFNNGLVILKSTQFAEHWRRLCFTNHFANYQYREQDFLNMLCSDYFNYTVKLLEVEKIYGEWAKPYWAQTYMKDGKVMFKVNDKELQLCMYHAGGGNTPDKGNYRIRFPQEVIDYMETLIK